MFASLKRKVTYYFVSSTDKALNQHRRKHKRTASQQAEYDKYKVVYKLRDHS